MAREIIEYGTEIQSFGGSFRYKVLGAVCLLYDKSQLSWFNPEKEQRFVCDLATKNRASYVVELLDYPKIDDKIKFLTSPKNLKKDLKNWWYNS
jgi:hypothetical protein